MKGRCLLSTATMPDTLHHVPTAALDATLPSSRTGGPSEPLPAPNVLATSRRATVLPRVEWIGERPSMVPIDRERFEELQPLGHGGMGEVVLLQDHDIERKVALKRLAEASGVDHVLRFVEEIRTVGQLDHPNIVPVHDVGVDAQGRYYFVMKHLQGETLESIITRLRAGDPAAHARFPIPVRAQIFLGVLNALAYAHRKGFIHRDLKPANIMVGAYGEVTVVDWGLARRIHSQDTVAHVAEPEAPRDVRKSFFMKTQAGTLVGTPLYMSPEQAQGKHEAVDVRSDTYSLTVLFDEFLYLKHYLDGRESLAEVLQGVESVTPPVQTSRGIPQSPVPAEYVWFLHKGFAKDPAQRYQSADAMMDALRGLMEGRIEVRCERTLLKRGLHETLRRVDRYPKQIFAGGAAAAAIVAASLGHLLWAFFAG
ncbi:serine/threonine-protein kinase [Stigmatella sp. ncwal1]|uniref:Serine/threonine-protein kinase n=1 Tax=Stigmatella ashevillensis TaxID=2995309 RepID=A0ABT5DFT0_9BACT|nr:serine/threonine-protein kinase [Stigmatella ashevillena]MDC0712010.1 serine/threonine-protein kinase [Stigmatella ashevillena]